MILDLTSLKQALATLDAGLKMLAQKPNDDFVRDACVQRFEYCYELSHKSLRRYLQASEAAAVDVPSASSFPRLSASAISAACWPATGSAGINFAKRATPLAIPTIALLLIACCKYCRRFCWRLTFFCARLS